MAEVKDILLTLGYKLNDTGNDYRANPLYRPSDNASVLSIKKDTGFWYDYKTGQHGTLEQLVKVTLGLPSGKAKEWLKDRQWDASKVIIKPKINELKVFPNEILLEMEKDYSFWENRGISSKTLDIFQGGVISSGRMKDRFTFPIFNSKRQIVGLSGRELLEDGGRRPKWKHIGDKTQWAYPLIINKKAVFDTGEIILVESIGDMLALWEAGVRQVVVTFGLSVSNSLLNIFLKVDPRRIFISLNNDDQSSSAGNKASLKMKDKLLKYFDRPQVKIEFPDKNDLGDMTTKKIDLWRKKLCISLHQE